MNTIEWTNFIMTLMTAFNLEVPVQGTVVFITKS